jgi:hypothetical protein
MESSELHAELAALGLLVGDWAIEAEHPAFARNEHRVYGASMRNRTLRLWRKAPGFSQRYSATLSKDGRALPGLWELCRDGSSWEPDLSIAYSRS